MIPLSKTHPRYWPPIMSDPKLAAEVERLSHQIAGEGAPDHVLKRARKVAEAQVEYNRVYEVYRELAQLSPTGFFSDLYAAAKLTKVKSPAHSMILAIFRYEVRAFQRWSKASDAVESALRRDAASARRRVLKRWWEKGELDLESGEVAALFRD